MQFSNDTRINPEATADNIPIIHGKNYYIDEQQYIATFNKESTNVFDQNGYPVIVQSLQPVTEFIYIVNHKVAYRTTQGILVTDLEAPKDKYVGGFQGIAGFNETETSYQYINSNSNAKSTVTLTGRISTSKKLEVYLSNLDTWVVPLGEFRCFIDNTLYTINYNTTLPNSFGSTFTVTLLGWTNVEITPSTNYIRDIYVAGNTLYLSTRLQIIGSTPYDWSDVDTTKETVVWSEDSRIIDSYFVGNPTATYFFLVNYNTSSIYWIDSIKFDILQEYQHRMPILGVGSIDKFSIGVVDKEACSIISAYVSLNTWLMKTKLYFQFNQLSAYEEMFSNYLREEVVYVEDLNAIVIKSSQRANMMLYILNNKVLSGCHTDDDIVAGDYSAYNLTEDGLLHYTRVEDSGEYNTIDKDAGILNYDSYIYIGSDLEPDNGGSTLRDTEITFEGKIALEDGNDISVESSGDIPVSEDLPVRTQQANPDNWWYLYSKVLRYPVSYTTWIKISLMPTTKIFNIKLAEDATQNTKQKGAK